MAPRTVLVPVDFSPCSRALVAQARSLVEALGGRLVLLHVIEPVDGVAGTARIRTPEGERPLLPALLEEARGALEGYDTGPIPTSFATRVVDPVEAILEAIEDLGADMVVMGTHGRQGLAHLVLGSVAEQVVRRAGVPVLTIRSTHHPACHSPSCAWCADGRLPVQEQARCESEG